MVAAMEGGSEWRFAGECNWEVGMETGSICCVSVAADGGGCSTWRQAAIDNGWW